MQTYPGLICATEHGLTALSACAGEVQAMLAIDAAPWSFRKLGLLVMPPVSSCSAKQSTSCCRAAYLALANACVPLD